MGTRYELRTGKFGQYFHDTKTKNDVPLMDALAIMNQAEPLENNLMASGAIKLLEKKLIPCEEFILKTAGKSTDPRYTKDPDYWHDLGWEKDLEEVMNILRPAR